MTITSKTEYIFSKILTEMGILFQRQYFLQGKYYDFYLPKYNILIEIDGDYWHGNKKYFNHLNLTQLKSRWNDKYKNFIALSCNKKLVRIWASEIKNKNNIRVKLLKEINNK